MPRSVVAASEVRVSPSYHLKGKNRQGDEHVIFQYTFSGNVCFKDKSGKYKLEAGDAFLCEARDPSVEYYYPKNGTEPYNFFWFCFTGETGFEMARELIKRHGPIYKLSKNSIVLTRLMQFAGKGRNLIELAPAQSAGLVTDLLINLAESKDKNIELTPANLLIRQALQIIRESLDTNLNVTELANALEISREHLTRVFKEQTGLTPYQYINRQKMSLACHMLKETRLSIKEIAKMLGYEESAHFTRAFSSFIHTSPSKFRESGTMPIL
jgi:AraC-like DNA-binding protein